MNLRALGTALSLSLLLTGCGKAEDAFDLRGSSGQQGRYIGIGVYEAGTLWSKMAAPGDNKDASLAKIADDEHIIVVTDSKTGEVRECGDYRPPRTMAGFCQK